MMLIDRHEFERLYYRYSPRMTSFATQILSDATVSQDIVQDVFILFWEKYNGKTIESAPSLLFTILRNRCLDYLKHMNIHNLMMAIMIRESKMTEKLYWRDFNMSNVEQKYLYNELEKAINDAISSLPDRCAAIFTLSRNKGLRHKEIAEKFGITEKTVENQIGKAIKVIRKKIDKL